MKSEFFLRCTYVFSAAEVGVGTETKLFLQQTVSLMSFDGRWFCDHPNMICVLEGCESASQTGAVHPSLSPVQSLPHPLHSRAATDGPRRSRIRDREADQGAAFSESSFETFVIEETVPIISSLSMRKVKQLTSLTPWLLHTSQIDSPRH